MAIIKAIYYKRRPHDGKSATSDSHENEAPTVAKGWNYVGISYDGTVLKPLPITWGVAQFEAAVKE